MLFFFCIENTGRRIGLLPVLDYSGISAAKRNQPSWYLMISHIGIAVYIVDTVVEIAVGKLEAVFDVP